jgi:hypothetical protein
MMQGDGSYAPSYNVQLSEDAQHDIIAGVGVSQSCNDYSDLPPAADRAEAATGKTPRDLAPDFESLSPKVCHCSRADV